MSSKPLYFPTHEGNPGVFSGYGISLMEDAKSPLIGMLMIDRPSPCPPAYIRELKDTFGEVFIGPITSNYDRGVYARMGIEDPLSLELLRDDVHGDQVDYINGALEMAVRVGRLPNPRLRVEWSRERGLWLSRFDDLRQFEGRCALFIYVANNIRMWWVHWSYWPPVD
jgi:hypothetical protein